MKELLTDIVDKMSTNLVDNTPLSSVMSQGQASETSSSAKVKKIHFTLNKKNKN